MERLVRKVPDHQNIVVTVGPQGTLGATLTGRQVVDTRHGYRQVDVKPKLHAQNVRTVAPEVKGKFWSRPTFKTQYGWKFHDYRAPDLLHEPVLSPLKQFDWNNKVATTIQAADRTGAKNPWVPQANPDGLLVRPQKYSPRGGNTPRKIQTLNEYGEPFVPPDMEMDWEQTTTKALKDLTKSVMDKGRSVVDQKDDRPDDPMDTDTGFNQPVDDMSTRAANQRAQMTSLLKTLRVTRDHNLQLPPKMVELMAELESVTQDNIDAMEGIEEQARVQRATQPSKSTMAEATYTQRILGEFTRILDLIKSAQLQSLPSNMSKLWYESVMNQVENLQQVLAALADRVSDHSVPKSQLERHFGILTDIEKRVALLAVFSEHRKRTKMRPEEAVKQINHIYNKLGEFHVWLNQLLRSMGYAPSDPNATAAADVPATAAKFDEVSSNFEDMLTMADAPTQRAMAPVLNELRPARESLNNIAMDIDQTPTATAPVIGNDMTTAQNAAIATQGGAASEAPAATVTHKLPTPTVTGTNIAGSSSMDVTDDDIDLFIHHRLSPYNYAGKQLNPPDPTTLINNLPYREDVGKFILEHKQSLQERGIGLPYYLDPNHSDFQPATLRFDPSKATSELHPVTQAEMDQRRADQARDAAHKEYLKNNTVLDKPVPPSTSVVEDDEEGDVTPTLTRKHGTSHRLPVKSRPPDAHTLHQEKVKESLDAGKARRHHNLRTRHRAPAPVRQRPPNVNRLPPTTRPSAHAIHQYNVSSYIGASNWRRQRHAMATRGINYRTGMWSGIYEIGSEPMYTF